MRWSKLKQLVEARMAPSVAGRVGLHVAGYTEAHDGQGRAWITIDKREIVNFCDLIWNREHWQLGDELRARGLWRNDGGASIVRGLVAQGIFDRYRFYRALYEYLSLPIADALNSDNGVIRALALLDARTGKRRLRTIVLRDDEFPWVRALFELRCEAEGIAHEPSAPAGLAHASA